MEPSALVVVLKVAAHELVIPVLKVQESAPNGHGKQTLKPSLY